MDKSIKETGSNAYVLDVGIVKHKKRTLAAKLECEALEATLSAQLQAQAQSINNNLTVHA